MKAEDILGTGYKTEQVQVPGWAEAVVVHELGALDSVRWKREVRSAEPQVGDDLRVVARLVIRSTRTLAGELLFNESQLDEVANLPDHILTLLVKAASRVNGITEEAIKQAEADFGQAQS